MKVDSAVLEKLVLDPLYVLEALRKGYGTN